MRVTDTDVVYVGDAVYVEVCEGVGDQDAVMVGETVAVALKVPEIVNECDAVSVAVREVLLVSDPDREEVAEKVEVRDDVTE